MEQFLCDAIIANGASCFALGHIAVDTYHFCGTHFNQYNRVKAIHGIRHHDRCRKILPRQNYCGNNRTPGQATCLLHTPIEPVLHEDAFEPPPPAPLPVLARFVADNQNVHRSEISDRTNKATDFLLKRHKDPKEWDEEDAAKHLNVWKDLALPFSETAVCWDDYLYVMCDMHKWWDTKTCRKKADHLYMRLLFSLVEYIKTSEHKAELWKRLWEECLDAAGMCCEGHISRLCNVLSGYVEGIETPVALGELTQQKMAAIAGMEVSEDDKKRMANEFFDTHAIPAADRVAWLEAF